MFSYRKVGGIRFLSIGRLRFSFCVARAAPTVSLRKPRMARRVATFVTLVREA